MSNTSDVQTETYDLDLLKTVIREDAKGNRHIWGVSKCKLILDKNQFDQKMFIGVQVGEEGRLITYKNPCNGNTTWEVVFAKYKTTIADTATLERYIKKI